MPSLIAVIDNEGVLYSFDSSYQITFNGQEVRVSKVKKSDYFYGERIPSVTCIAGKNGSGKTTLMASLFEKLLVADEKKNSKFAQFFVSAKMTGTTKEIIDVFTTGQWTVTSPDCEIDMSGTFVDNVNLIKYSAAIETNYPHVESSQKRDVTNTYKLKINSLEDVQIEEMFAQVRFVLEHFFDLSREEELMNWEKKEIIASVSQHGQGISKTFEKYFFSPIIKKEIDYKKIKEMIKTKVSHSHKRIGKVLAMQLLIIIGSKYQTEDEENKTKDHEIDKRNSYDEVLREFLNLRDTKSNNYDALVRILIEGTQGTEEEKEQLYGYKIILDQFLNNFQQSSIYQLKTKEIKENKIKNQLSDLQRLTNIMAHYDVNNPDLQSFFSVFQFSWKGISSGEYNMLNMFGAIFAEFADSVMPDKTSLLILLIDEADLGFHPEWQRRWMTLVPKYLTKIIGSVDIQLIMSTHSPILLSDIRDQDVILLPKNENNQIGKTFGQNIHSLLTHNFFMDNTIGAFSQAKITALFDIFTSPWEAFQRVLYDESDFTNAISTIIDDWGEEISDERVKKIRNVKKSYIENSKSLENEKKKSNLTELDKKWDIKDKRPDFVNQIEKLLNNKEVVERSFNYRGGRFLGMKEKEVTSIEVLEGIDPFITMIGEEFYRGRLVRKYEEYQKLVRLLNHSDQQLEQEIKLLQKEQARREAEK